MSSSATPALTAQRKEPASQEDGQELLYRWPEADYYTTLTNRRLKSVDEDPAAALLAGCGNDDDDDARAEVVVEEEADDIDVTSLIRKRKKKPAAAPSGAADAATLPPLLFDAHKSMPAFRCLDALDDHLVSFSNDDISLLVNTLSQLTGQRVDENESPALSSPQSSSYRYYSHPNPPVAAAADGPSVEPEPAAYTPTQQQSGDLYRSQPRAAGGLPRPPPPPPTDYYGLQRGHYPPFGAEAAPAAYYGLPQPPAYAEDSQIIVKGHNLTYWRALFLSLAFAAPLTLQSYVMSLGSKGNPAGSAHRGAAAGGGGGGNSAMKGGATTVANGAPVVRPPPSEGRFKQIARGKSTREYLAYIQAVPREQRVEGVDPSTPRVEGSSWREFQAEVRAWKRMLHRKYEYLESLKAAASASCAEQGAA